MTIEVITNNLGNQQDLEESVSTNNERNSMRDLKVIQVENGFVNYVGD